MEEYVKATRDALKIVKRQELKTSIDLLTLDLEYMQILERLDTKYFKDASFEEAWN